jgi:predicted dehydrogenase
MFATATAIAASSAGAALAADEQKEPRSANEKLSVAIIGVNGRGGSHIGAFLGNGETEITYICDADENVGQRRAADIGKKQGRAPKFVKDMRQVFDDGSVDCVSSATPNHWHSLLSIWAMQAGKDVYIEKPVSHNVSEGRRMVETARKYGRICQTGTQCRSHSGVADAVKYIHDGKLGEVKLARGLCYKPRGSIGKLSEPLKIPSHIDYELWCGPAAKVDLYRPKLHYDWHWDFNTGCGDLGNQGIHQMDIARWGLGVNELAQGVVSYGGRLGYEDAADTANTQVGILDYGDKTLVFETRGLRTGDYRGAKIGVIFEGTEGYIVNPSYTSSTCFDRDGKVVTKFGGGGDHFGNFIKAVKSRKSEDLNADIGEGHLSSALCHLCNISYRLGEEKSAGEILERLSEIKSNDDVKATLERTRQHLVDNKVDLAKTPLRLGPLLALDPKTETFIKNSKADDLLTREYRAPFIVPPAGKV